MPRKFILTWQPGMNQRSGRWRKKYKGKAYHFQGGRGKTDREAYEAALAEWYRLKVKLDAEATKSHQADYEHAIARWEQVLTWCRNHNEADMAETATEKLKSLRRRLAASEPAPLTAADTFDGQFDWSVRFPGWSDAVSQIVKSLELSDGLRTDEDLNEPLVVPPKEGLDSDPLRDKLLVWHDRLEVAARSATSTEDTLRAHVAGYIAVKKAAVESGQLSRGRIYTVGLHLEHFADWLGGDTPVANINSKILSNYRLKLLEQVEASSWSRSTAKTRLSNVVGFVRWLWQVEAIPNLPRILDGKSTSLTIEASSGTIVTFTTAEITTLLAEASDRTKLYILLMLNCGMTQKDIADLQVTEVDWDRGRICRKRSKTKKHAKVPTVSYSLWGETVRLLKQERSSQSDGNVLLNDNGRSLWYEEVGSDVGLKKNDNIRSAFARLSKKTGITKPLKSLKKTSASLIRNNAKYASLESLFLGHAPQSMADKHYAATPQELLDEAIGWLEGEYGLK